MNKVENVCQPGTIATIERFTFVGFAGDDNLRQYVVYTYYNSNGESLYVGGSKDFYNAHYLNYQRLSFMHEVEYVGFVFFKNEEDIKDAKKFYIKNRNPKYNKHKYSNLTGHVEIEDDVLVVYCEQMERRWREWLGSDDIDCAECPYREIFEFQNKWG